MVRGDRRATRADSSSDWGRDLLHRMALFVEHNLGESSGSAALAARRVGYRTPLPAEGQHATECYVYEVFASGISSSAP